MAFAFPSVPTPVIFRRSRQHRSSTAGSTHAFAQTRHRCSARSLRLPCRRPGLAERLAEPAGDHGGAVRGWRADGLAGAHPATHARRDAGPADHHREHPRRRRPDRFAPGVAGCRGQPHVRARLDRHARDRLLDALKAGVSPGQRLPAGGIRRRRTADADGEEGFAAEQSAGIHCLHQSEPRQDDVFVRRHRHLVAHQLRDAEPDHGGQCHPRALPRRRAGVPGPDRRAHRLHLQLRVDRRAGGEGRPGQGAGDAGPRAHRGRARSADRRTTGAEGFRRFGLERDFAAEERDACDGGEIQCRGEQGARQSSDAGTARRAGPHSCRAGAAQPAVSAKLHRERDREMGQAGESERPAGGLRTIRV